MHDRQRLEKRIIAQLGRLGPAEKAETICSYCGRREVMLSPRGVQVVTLSAPTTVAAWLRGEQGNLKSTKFLSARVVRLDHLVDFLIENSDKLRVDILKDDWDNWEDTHHDEVRD